MTQADISLLVKTQLLERLTSIRKAFEKQKKDKETAANKAVSWILFVVDSECL